MGTCYPISSVSRCWQWARAATIRRPNTGSTLLHLHGILPHRCPAMEDALLSLYSCPGAPLQHSLGLPGAQALCGNTHLSSPDKAQHTHGSESAPWVFVMGSQHIPGSPSVLFLMSCRFWISSVASLVRAVTKWATPHQSHWQLRWQRKCGDSSGEGVLQG